MSLSAFFITSAHERVMERVILRFGTVEVALEGTIGGPVLVLEHIGCVVGEGGAAVGAGAGSGDGEADAGTTGGVSDEDAVAGRVVALNGSGCTGRAAASPNRERCALSESEIGSGGAGGCSSGRDVERRT